MFFRGSKAGKPGHIFLDPLIRYAMMIIGPRIPDAEKGQYWEFTG